MLIFDSQFKVVLISNSAAQQGSLNTPELYLELS